MSSTIKETIIDYAREILALESQAILNCSALLDNEFERAVEILLSLPKGSRVIVSGMGKAGFVGMKLSATLASTGVPSFFLHPAEAIHGDLGRYARGDVAVVLSNSGETSEVLAIIPAIKRMGCPIISITGKPTSTLARQSAAVLKIGEITEAGPLSLAPTSSTAVMLAMGDALAMAVLSQQNFSKEQFALYHPGGSLGRQFMTVDEIMRTGDELAVVTKDMKAREVLHVITATKGRPGAAAVVSKDGTLCGVFTDGDFRRCLDRDEAFLGLPISEVMGKSPKTVEANVLVQEAHRVMSEYKIDQLIVVDAGKRPIGLVDIQDVMAVLV